jgi:NADH-quinone oxidoreductase subunit J
MIIIGAVLTVTVKHVLHAAICLMGTLFTTGALFLLMFAEFVAVMQVLVYIGGVVIFIIYAILLTSDLGEKFIPVPAAKRAMAATFSLLLAALISYLLVYQVTIYSDPIVDKETSVLDEGRMTTVSEIGVRLLDAGPTGFLIPFEVISLILLAALIAAATIARKSKQEVGAAS